jgi:Mitochondrial carrier protein
MARGRSQTSLAALSAAVAAAATLLLPTPPCAAVHAARAAAHSRPPSAVLVSSAGERGHQCSFRVAASAALVASTAATLICHPIDTLKTLKQAESMTLSRANGTSECDSGIGGKFSLRILYRGVASNILKEAPNAAIYLGCYELFRAWLVGTVGGVFAAHPLLACCLAGMMGDAVGSVVRVPAEIVNKRLQVYRLFSSLTHIGKLNPPVVVSLRSLRLDLRPCSVVFVLSWA